MTPRHVAVSADGNGRWALEKGLNRSVGHAAGERPFREFVDRALDLNIEWLSFHIFTPQNFGRPASEVNSILELSAAVLCRAIPMFLSRGIRFEWHGSTKLLPPDMVDQLLEASSVTESGGEMCVTWLINFGGREELTEAAARVANAISSGHLSVDDVNAALMDRYMWPAPDVDLFIRSSGEQRISNFSLWRIAYSELFFVEKLWPDISADDLERAVEWFRGRSRTYGGLR